jgi:hypothetical protein
MLEELDKPRLEAFLTKLEEFKERVEIKKQRKNCLDIVRDIKEIIKNQEEGHEHREHAKKKNEEPSVPQEGRKLYATKFGDKCHFERYCKGFNGRPNIDWKSCMTCQSKTEGILGPSNSGSSSSTDVRATGNNLVFELKGSDYHAEDCTARKDLAKGETDKKTMCQLCAKDERLLVSVRSRYSTSAKK